jgi:cyclic pyranopterin phosphate synthase
MSPGTLHTNPQRPGQPAIAAVVADDAMPGVLVDPQGRRLDYLRLAVTDRCNLRCRYCMPAAGVPLGEREEILSIDELIRLGALFADLGVRSFRITGGEPLVRRGLTTLIRSLRALPSAPEVLLTTNGLLLADHLDALIDAGLERVNLSLDSLVETTWTAITRREGFDRVRAAVDLVLERGLGLKINMVVLPGWNDHELDDFVELTRDRALTVRFIEPMPFLGEGRLCGAGISGPEILARLAVGPFLEAEPFRPGAVELIFRVPGFAGKVGIIEGHSRTFCGTCRRLRVDARGQLRTCLYGKPSAFLRPLMRAGADDQALTAAIRGAVAGRLPDGLAAEADHRRHNLDSMVNIGG